MTGRPLKRANLLTLSAATFGSAPRPYIRKR